MSRKSSFANLRGSVATATKTDTVPLGAVPVIEPGSPGGALRPVSRQGRKQIAGFFSPEMSLAMHVLARRQGRSLQALMAEAFNDVLRKHGESPIGD